MSTLHDLLSTYRAEARNTRDQGDRFERLMRAFFRTDPYYAQLFETVWLWQDWPGRRNRSDTGIDLVAVERDTGAVWAIQCKFFAHSIEKSDLDSFFTESGKVPFSQRLIVATAPLSKHAQAAFEDQQIPVHTLTLTDLEQSRVDWSQFTWQAPDDLAFRAVKTLRPHQVQAIQAVRDGFDQADRGQLIMACGTGKTLTGLRLAEQLLPSMGGTVLVLTPSIALVSQTLREWTAEAERPLRAFAVCSDTKVGLPKEEDFRPSDLAFPATTNADKLAKQWARPARPGTLTVIFSTYQSIEIVAQAQRSAGLGPFDLVIADEAHRTVGQATAKAASAPSAFTQVHDDRYLPARKRLYMTATPRIYSGESKRKADDDDLVLFSMDDPAVFGPEFHRLSFSVAVEAGILSDYKVLILTVDETEALQLFGDAVHDAENFDARLDDEAKIIGCLNALAKRFPREEDDDIDPAPMQRVVAFTNTIAASQRMTHLLAEANATLLADGPLRHYEPEHIDGTMNITNRNAALDRLREPFDDTTCRIVTNARCLTEGVDVPALDAVVFFQPRDSQVDVVQAVGRVMRKADNKQFGYVILPVVIPAGADPETALADSKAYKVVWQVLNALRSHDDHFNDLINQLEFNQKSTKLRVIGKGRTRQPAAEQLSLYTTEQLQNAFYAKIVRHCGTREYWDEWARKVGNLAARYQTHIVDILTRPDVSTEPTRHAFGTFLTELQASVNDRLTREDAIEMLAQHLVTQPIFDALFEGYAFTASNPVSQAMAPVVEQLTGLALWKEKEGAETAEGRVLTAIRDEVQRKARGIDNALGKQQLIVRIYDKFFKVALKQTADRLGIVYTPTEIVDFILHSVDAILREQWGMSLSESNVHILDPFTGTGTFLVRLLQSELIAPEDLSRKYREELHANELVLLPYYIAAINIEETFHRLTGQPYTPFPGITLTDTFEQGPGRVHEIAGVARVENNARVNRQNTTDIRVIVGNPPYSVGQGNANNNNQNLKYPHLDRRIAETYASSSTATNKNSLYDAYIRAFRWASDRIGDQGIIGFVTNGGWINGNTMDGFRKHLQQEFTEIYVWNLRGNQRTSGETSRREGGKIFGSGSRAPIAITLLVKNSARVGEEATIRYADIGDYLSREDKLTRVNQARSVQGVSWTTIRPNAAYDWVRQRTESFSQMVLLGDRNAATPTIFHFYSNGVQTNRDAWAYNFDRIALADNMARMIEVFNEQVVLVQSKVQTKSTSPANMQQAMSLADRNPRHIKWTSELFKDLCRGSVGTFNEHRIGIAMYRPFCKQWVYYDPQFNHRYKLSFYPSVDYTNLAISVTGTAATKDFSCFITNCLPDLEHISKGQCFPRTYYAASVPSSAAQMLYDYIPETPNPRYQSHEGITDFAWRTARDRYGPTCTREDLFYYVYGVLHSEEYRTRFADDLKKMLPRIPWVDRREDFWAFSQAGRDLAHWHLDHETIEPWPVEEAVKPTAPEAPSERYHVEKMRFGKGDERQVDKTVILVNPYLTLTGIPLAAYSYVVNGRSAIEWVLDQYQIKQDKASGIVNDPNQWSADPRYIVDLVKRVVRVSMETLRIIAGLPRLGSSLGAQPETVSPEESPS